MSDGLQQEENNRSAQITEVTMASLPLLSTLCGGRGRKNIYKALTLVYNELFRIPLRHYALLFPCVCKVQVHGRKLQYKHCMCASRLK